MIGERASAISIRRFVRREFLVQAVLVALVLGWFGVHVYQSAQRQRVAERLFEIQRRTVDLVLLSSERVENPSRRSLTQWENTWRKLSEAVDALPPRHAVDLGQMLTRVGNAHGFLQGTEAPEKFRYLRMVQETQLLAHHVYSIRQEIVDRTSSSHHETLSLAAAMLLTVLALQLLATRTLQKQIVDRLSEMLPLFRQIGEGDFRQQAPPVNIVELQPLREAVETMRWNLLEITVSREKLSKEVEERSQAEARAMQLLDDLEKAQAQMLQMEKLSALGVFIGGVADEIGKPLKALDQLLQRAKTHNEDPRVAEWLENAGHEVERVGRTVADLLMFVRRERSGEPATGNLADVVETLRSRFEPELSRRGVAFQVEISDGLPELNMRNPSMLQVLSNLMSNSLDALEKERPGRITLRALRYGRQLMIWFEDNGSGIPWDRPERVFDPFFTTRPPGEGAGLGLGISRHLLEQAGGEIILETTSEAGTTFKITLPLGKAGAQPGD